MELELVEVTIGGVHATKEEVRKHLRERVIELPPELARKMIENLQKKERQSKSPVPQQSLAININSI